MTDTATEMRQASTPEMLDYLRALARGLEHHVDKVAILWAIRQIEGDKDIHAAIAGLRDGFQAEREAAFNYHTWDGAKCRWCGCATNDYENATRACPTPPSK